MSHVAGVVRRGLGVVGLTVVALVGARAGAERAEAVRRVASAPEATWLAPTSTLAPVPTALPVTVELPVTVPSEAPVSTYFDGTLRLRTMRPGALSVGTAFVVGDGTWALTNRHVVEDARTLEVESWDGEPRGGATVAAVGPPTTDLALLRLELPSPGALHLATATAPVDTSVTAGGYPDARQFTRSTGRLLAVNEEEGRTILVTDVPAAPGSSGSPLLDRAGTVVGVIFGGSGGYTLAVPAADAVALLASQQVAV